MVRTLHVLSAFITDLCFSIAFPFVSTHNHFVYDHRRKAFNRHAPIIKVAEAREQMHSLDGITQQFDVLFLAAPDVFSKGRGPNRQ